MLIVVYDKAILRVLLDIARAKNPMNSLPGNWRSVPLEEIAELIGRIDGSDPDPDQAFDNACLLRDMGLIKMSEAGLDWTQVGLLLASNLEWRDEARAREVVAEFVAAQSGQSA